MNDYDKLKKILKMFVGDYIFQCEGTCYDIRATLPKCKGRCAFWNAQLNGCVIQELLRGASVYLDY